MRIGGLYLTDLGYGPGRRKISQIALTAGMTTGILGSRLLRWCGS
jgi:hypothetical protein